MLHTCNENLPRLAWCARIQESDAAIHVLHGPWVETWESGFVEGAWSGDFQDRDFDRSDAFAGTGALVRNGRLFFVAGTDLQGRLYTMRLRGELVVSNSLCFLLQETGDRPDPNFGYYSGETLLQCVLGINRSRRSLPMQHGVVDIHECVNLELLPDRTLFRHPKPTLEPPNSYHEYIELMEASVGSTLANAMDPLRKQVFPPVATLSQGYDSPFVGALARKHGCTRALTFVDSPRHVSKQLEDSGSELGARLGMSVEEFRHLDFITPDRCTEAEFCVSPPAIDYPLASFEDRLAGKTLLTGSFGDSVLSTHEKDLLTDFRQTTFYGLCGSTMTEYRLRVGFINFPPLFIGGLQIKAIGRISNSEAMRPWSVEGDYDRPIARRYLNEAGIPDDMFGTRKKGSAWGLFKKIEELSPASQDDFRKFLSEHSGIVTSKGTLLSWGFFKQFVRIQSRLKPGKNPVRRLPASVKRYTRNPFEDLLFHWGVSRTCDRYAIAPKEYERTEARSEHDAISVSV